MMIVKIAHMLVGSNVSLVLSCAKQKQDQINHFPSKKLRSILHVTKVKHTEVAIATADFATIKVINIIIL